MEVLSGP
jgi:transposase-like protein